MEFSFITNVDVTVMERCSKVFLGSRLNLVELRAWFLESVKRIDYTIPAELALG